MAEKLNFPPRKANFAGAELTWASCFMLLLLSKANISLERNTLLFPGNLFTPNCFENDGLLEITARRTFSVHLTLPELTKLLLRSVLRAGF